MTRNYIINILFPLFIYAPYTAHAYERFPILNLNYDNSQQLALEAGFIIGPEIPKYKGGVVISVEPGIAGIKYHIGLGYSDLTEGGVIAYRLSWTELKMNKDYNDFIRDNKYSGVEILIGAAAITLQVGYLQNNENDDNLFVAGIGLGF